jgi:hypothetical protein
MTAVNAAAEKGKKTFASDDAVLDTTRMKPVNADRPSKSSDIANVSEVAS